MKIIKNLRFQHLALAFYCLFIAGIFNQINAQTLPDVNAMLDANNVSWDVPGPGSAESMPIGNGDIGLNVWVETNGDLVFYISKTDSWSESHYGSWALLKLGKVRITLNPQPVVTPFLQVLKLRTGEISIALNNTTFKVWVDANNPVIRIESTSVQPVVMTVALESWRTKSENGVSADIIRTDLPNKIAWYHRNTTSEPALSNLTFGAVIKGDGMVGASSTSLQSSIATNSQLISIYPLTATTSTLAEWELKLDQQIADIDALNLESTRDAHQAWWSQFWNRSWVFVRGDAMAQNTTQGYVLQRFITACGGRGAYPMKFNGSIFVVDNPILDAGNSTTKAVNADYRTWGGQYWFQNTRAMYWPRLAAGDFDIMLPLFDMYTKLLPANAAQVLKYYGHDGAYFAETAPFWGGLKYAGAEVAEDWTLHYFSPILELTMMALDYYEYTGDEKVAKEKLLPLAKAGMTFYDKHFARDASGKLLLDPVNSIEMYWKVTNPAPDIAGLRAVLPRLIALPESLVDNPTREIWIKLLSEIPELPTVLKDGYNLLLPYAGQQTARTRNNENPELYAVYPFRLFGMGKPNLQLAQNTFVNRLRTFQGCWSQDPIQAAMLGYATIAKSYVSYNLTRKDARQKFPAFWAKANDYTPDMDNGGNGENGLQQMIMQCEGKKIILLPAWPQGWDGDFKLNAPFQTTVQGTITNGAITNMVVTPIERTADVTVIVAQTLVKKDRTGWVATSTNRSENAYKVLDNNSTTYWSTGAVQIPGQSFTVKFNKKEQINKLTLDNTALPGDYPQSYQLLFSDNGSDWYGPVMTGKGSSAITEIAFPSSNVQYVRILQTGTKGGYWAIHELNAYGIENGTGIDVTGVTINPTNSTVSVGGSLQLSSTILPQNADNQKVFWVSGSPDIATIDANGVLTAIKEGITIITAVTMDGLYKSTFTLNVSGSTAIKQVADGKFRLEICPNQVKSILKIQLFLPVPYEVTLTVYDLHGIIQKEIKNSYSAGQQSASIDIKNLKTGNYIVKATVGRFIQNKRFVVE